MHLVIFNKNILGVTNDAQRSTRLRIARVYREVERNGRYRQVLTLQTPLA